jgi:hypothetical protein
VEAVQHTRWERFLTIPKAAWEGRPDGAWVVATAILAMLCAASRNRALRVVSLGFVGVYVLNLLAGGVLLPNRPFGDLSNSRYWIQYFPAVALVVGGLTALGARWAAERVSASPRWKRPAVSALVAVAVCIVPLWHAQQFLTNVQAFAPNGGNALEQLRDYAAGTKFSAERVWTDSRTLRLLPVFQRPVFGGEPVWTGKGRALNKDSTPEPGDAVLFYGAHDTGVCYHCHLNIQGWLRRHPTVPSNWQLVFATDDKTVELYRVK